MRILGWVFTPSLWPTLAAALMTCVLCALGLWQLARAAEKDDLQHQFAARLQNEPIPLPAALDRAANVGDWRYRRVIVSGRYLVARQFLLDNRTYQGVAGYHVLTTLVLEHPVGSAMLVNRGWLAVGGYRDRLPALPAPEGPVRLQGIIAVPPRDGLLLGDSGYDEAGWPRVVQNVDLPRIEGGIELELLPFLLWLDPDQPHGFVREWKPHAGFGPARHRGYAFQWFSLATALVVIYVVVNAHRVTA